MKDNHLSPHNSNDIIQIFLRSDMIRIDDTPNTSPLTGRPHQLSRDDCPNRDPNPKRYRLQQCIRDLYAEAPWLLGARNRYL